MDVLGIATDASEALMLCREWRPGLVLLDIGLPDRSGLSVGAEMHDEAPETKIMALTALADHRVVKEAIRAGFSGYLMKDTNLDQLVSSIRAVVDGQVVLPQRLARGATGDRSPGSEHASLLASQLTLREREVLGLLAEALTSREIAARLNVSMNTVRTHVQTILSKLQVHSRLEAVAFAVRTGLVDVPRGPTRLWGDTSAATAR